MKIKDLMKINAWCCLYLFTSMVMLDGLINQNALLSTAGAIGTFIVSNIAAVWLSNKFKFKEDGFVLIGTILTIAFPIALVMIKEIIRCTTY